MQNRHEKINQKQIKIYLVGNIRDKGIFSRALKNEFSTQYGEKVIHFNNYSFCIDWMDNAEAWENYATHIDAAKVFEGKISVLLSDKPEYLFPEIDAKFDIPTLFNQLIDKKETIDSRKAIKESENKSGLILNSGLDHNSTLNCLPVELKSMIAYTLFAVTKNELLSSVNETTSNTFPAGQ